MVKNSKYFISLIFSALGFFYILLETSINELGASSDSSHYIEAVQNIIKGTGLNYYLTLKTWPPFYPIMLSFFSLISGEDSIFVSKYLSALLFFSTIFVFNLIIIKYKANNFTIILLNLLLITSSAMSVFLMIWSEPLFILLLMLLCYFFLTWIETDKRILFYLSAVLSGLLLLTRYAGIGFISGIIIFLLLKKDALKVKMLNIITFILIVLGIGGSWTLYLSNQSDNPFKRNIIFHLISKEQLSSIVTTFLQWISPISAKLGLIVILLFILLIFFDLRKRKLNFKFTGIRIENKFLIILLFSYLGFLLFFLTFISYTSVFFDNRIFSPVYPIILILSIPLIEKIQELKSLRFLFYALIIYILIANSYSFFFRSKNFYLNGEGYTNNLWINSETISNLKKFNKVSVFTNGINVLRILYTEENGVYSMPHLKDPDTGIENTEFSDQIEGMKEYMMSKGFILVFFDKSDWKNVFPKEDFVKNELQNFNYIECSDGIIFYK